MENRKKYEILLKIILLLVIVAVTVMITVFIMNNNRDNNTSVNNVTSNNTTNNTANTQQTQFDPYAKYKAMKWLRDTSVGGQTDSKTSRNITAWIDTEGVVNIKNNSNNSTVKITGVNEKAKYIAIAFNSQDLYGNNRVIILTEQGNIYHTFYALDYSTNSIVSKSSDLYKIASNSKILEMANNIDTAPHPAFNNYYGLTEQGELRLLDFNDNKLGITFEDNNSYKEIFGSVMCFIGIDSNGYLKDINNPKNYIQFNGNSIKVKYLLMPDGVINSPIYCITNDNKFLSINDENGYIIQEYTKKVVLGASYQAQPDTKIKVNWGNVKVNYTDGTSETFEVGNTSLYGF